MSADVELVRLALGLPEPGELPTGPFAALAGRVELRLDSFVAAEDLRLAEVGRERLAQFAEQYQKERARDGERDRPEREAARRQS